MRAKEVDRERGEREYGKAIYIYEMRVKSACDAYSGANVVITGVKVKKLILREISANKLWETC